MLQSRRRQADRERDRERLGVPALRVRHMGTITACGVLSPSLSLSLGVHVSIVKHLNLLILLLTLNEAKHVQPSQ